ncbi:MAG: hypothetical protein ACOYJI_01590 [Anaerovoracaceae bacterium]|jgi:hypothetical protein
MSVKLKKRKIEDGIYLSETACENFQCSSCGAKMISVNFVNGMCVQVFASHGPECEFADGNPAERTIEVTCDMCRYHMADGECTYDGGYNNRMKDVRSAAND